MKKNKNVDIHTQLDALNKITIAHMINELLYQHNINLVDYKPTCGVTLQMTEQTFNLHNEKKYAHQIDSFYVRYQEEFHEENSFSQQMLSMGICDFFEAYYKGYSIDVSNMIARKLKKIPSCDIVFNNQTPFDPFPSSIIKDPESGMCIRTISGLLFMENVTVVVTDIEFLVVDKMREVREGVIEVIR